MRKSRKMRWAWHVARMERNGCVWEFGGKSEAKKALRRPRHRGRIILKSILEKQDEAEWAGFIWLGIRISGEVL
jgi:hypothetical protein